MVEAAQSYYSPPVFDFSGKSENCSLLLKAIPQPRDPTDFWRCAEWSPDSSSILAQSESHSMYLYNMVHDQDGGGVSSSEPALNLLGTHKQSSPILSFKWFPTATLSTPETFCYVLSVREMPVKLIDGLTGRLRASYKIVDHRERQVAPHSMAFNGTASKLYCGFDSAIEVFDVQYPGKGERLHTTPRRKEKGGFRGIISSLAFSPDRSGVYAASSLNSGVALLSEDTDSRILSYLPLEHTVGTTQLAFSRTDPNILYSTARPSYAIHTWDLRNPTAPMRTYTRISKSNQRLGFDLDYSGKYLAGGSADGQVLVFDLYSPSEEPVLEYCGHSDVVGHVNFNAFEPLLLTVSGSRHFSALASDAEANRAPNPNKSDDSSSEEEYPQNAYLPRNHYLFPSPDASLKVWNFTIITPTFH